MLLEKEVRSVIVQNVQADDSQRETSRQCFTVDRLVWFLGFTGTYSCESSA